MYVCGQNYLTFPQCWTISGGQSELEVGEDGEEHERHDRKADGGERTPALFAQVREACPLLSDSAAMIGIVIGVVVSLLRMWLYLSLRYYMVVGDGYMWLACTKCIYVCMYVWSASHGGLWDRWMEYNACMHTYIYTEWLRFAFFILSRSF